MARAGKSSRRFSWAASKNARGPLAHEGQELLAVFEDAEEVVDLWPVMDLKIPFEPRGVEHLVELRRIGKIGMKSSRVEAEKRGATAEQTFDSASRIGYARIVALKVVGGGRELGLTAS